MPNRKYEKGRRAEYAIMKRLKEEGYICSRSAGSHSAFDVVAVNSEHVRLIQSKFGENGSAIAAARTELEKIKVPLNCVKEIWSRKSREEWKIEVVL